MNLWDKILFWLGKRWPGKYFVSRFVSGDTMEDAFYVAENLNKDGFEAIINFLGEEVKESEQARENTKMYSEIIKEIFRRKLNARVSVKPSQLGIKISQEFYRHNLLEVGRDAFLKCFPLEIDMETEDTVAATIQETIYLKKYYSSKHFGEIDLRQALAMNFKESFVHLYNLTAAGVKIRLCKGVYPSKYDEKTTAQKFLNAASHLLRQKVNPDFFTHDLRILERIFFIRNECSAVCGFQFLFDSKKRIWKELVEKKEQVAIDIFFGANWLPYVKRRWKYIIKKSLQ